jgi:hypothetical protein
MMPGWWIWPIELAPHRPDQIGCALNRWIDAIRSKNTPE